MQNQIIDPQLIPLLARIIGYTAAMLSAIWFLLCIGPPHAFTTHLARRFYFFGVMLFVLGLIGILIDAIYPGPPTVYRF